MAKNAQMLETNSSNTDDKLRRRSPFSLLYDTISVECKEIGIWNSELAKDLPKKWEKHGDMVLLPENCFTDDQWRKMGRNLWRIVAECLKADRVGRKRRISPDDHRTPHIELLFGKHGWVEHIDNGISYQYDVTKCMFSIGNISEKLRLAQLDCHGETVVDLFAGIGYFTLPYLVHANASEVHACDWNPDAIEALRRNLANNKVEDRCVVYEGDCRKVAPVGVADRVNLGLLPTAHPYWLTACRALKCDTGGVLVIHENVKSSKVHLRRQQSSVDSGGIFYDANGDVPFSQEMGIDDDLDVTHFVPDERSDGNNTISEDSEDNVDIIDKKKAIARKLTAGQRLRLRKSSSLKKSSYSSTSNRLRRDATEKELKSETSSPNLTMNGHCSAGMDTENCNAADIDTARDSGIEASDGTTAEESDDVDRLQSDLEGCVEKTDSNETARRKLSMIIMQSIDEENRKIYTVKVQRSFVDTWECLDLSYRNFAVSASREILRFLNHMYTEEWSARILRIGKVKSYAPRIDHVVLDLECRPSGLLKSNAVPE